jgi:hypothetical protein
MSYQKVFRVTLEVKATVTEEKEWVTLSVCTPKQDIVKQIVGSLQCNLKDSIVNQTYLYSMRNIGVEVIPSTLTAEFPPQSIKFLKEN